ncbi:hypothetical protein [Janibacter alittae]|uniref:Uncharacterized protein n=1 Tax=Janibacter alittae TaxID=3115209 RepID=A0ABZ2MH44_9MICO
MDGLIEHPKRSGRLDTTAGPALARPAVVGAATDATGVDEWSRYADLP